MCSCDVSNSTFRLLVKKIIGLNTYAGWNESNSVLHPMVSEKLITNVQC